MDVADVSVDGRQGVVCVYEPSGFLLDNSRGPDG